MNGMEINQIKRSICESGVDVDVREGYLSIHVEYAVECIRSNYSVGMQTGYLVGSLLFIRSYSIMFESATDPTFTSPDRLCNAHGC